MALALASPSSSWHAVSGSTDVFVAVPAHLPNCSLCSPPSRCRASSLVKMIQMIGLRSHFHMAGKHARVDLLADGLI